MALSAAAVLLFEVAITRILSVVLWYHFAFLSVSLAMLALGVPGVWFALRPPGTRTLPRVLLAAGVALPASVLAIFHLGAVFPRVGTTLPGLQMLLSNGVLFVALCALVPLLLLGAAVCLLLMAAPGRSVGRMYAADLLGATVGALLVVPLMHVVPTPLLVAGAGLLPLAAAALVTPQIWRWSVVLGGALLGSLVWGAPYDLSWNKKYTEGAEGRADPIFEQWTPTARLTIFPDIFWQDDPDAAFGWGMGYRAPNTHVPQLWIEQDGSAGTPIVGFDGDLTSLEHLFFDVTSAGYQIARPDRVCIIGAGGGRDVLTALRAGATHVDAVELNPATIDAVSGPFAEFSGDVYHLPGVVAHAAEGRSFLTRSQGDYDLLQISLIDSWAATAAGAYALSENFLYTEEAMRLYWSRLSDTGTLSISRWIDGRHRLEAARLVVLAQAALIAEGVEDPLSHLAVVQGRGVANLLVSREPWSPARLAALDAVSATRGFLRHWPAHASTPPDSLVHAVLRQGVGPLEEMGFRLDPPTDDAPFFFQTVPVFGDVDPEVLDRLSANEGAGVMLRGLLLGIGGATLALFFAPFAVGGRLRRGPGFWQGSAYFASIGVAFMYVETAWLQRMILYLGHPSYATTVTLAALLLGAGLGAGVASRLADSRVKRLGWLLPVGLLLLNVGMGSVLQATIGWSLSARAVMAIVILAPAGFLMGLPFPLGMMRFGESHKAWFWAMNGATSVLASVSSLTLAMGFGFQQVAVFGAVAYLLAWALLARGSAAR